MSLPMLYAAFPILYAAFPKFCHALIYGKQNIASSWCVLPYRSADAQGSRTSWETHYHRYNMEAIGLILVSIIQKKCIISTQYHYLTL